MRFFIRTLGCKVNWLDSARITAALQSAGHRPANDEAEADFVFVNSCTVTSEADRKSRQMVNSVARAHKRVAVMGCGPRVDANGWGGGEDDNTLIFSDEASLLSHFGVEADSLLFPLETSRTRLPISVQSGCDNHCTFCITKIARGRHENLPAEQVVENVRQAVELGVKEVVLTGINLAAWGAADSNDAANSRLHELVERLLEETSIARIRFGSLGPQYLQPAFFALFSDERICDHLHLSIQSGSPSVLERMIRGHGIEEVYRIAEQARNRRPHTAITTDLIVGFPDESETEFEESLQLVRDIRFAKLHVFPFSPREGTPAAGMPGQIEQGVKKRRAAALRELGETCRHEFRDSQLGRSLDMLVEAKGSGLTGNYLRVNAGPLAMPGEIRTVTLSEENTSRR